MEIGILCESKRVSATDVAFIAAAVDYQMRNHVLPTWGPQLGREVWPVSVYAELPAQTEQMHPMFIMDDLGVPGALGFHDNWKGFIYSRCLPPSDRADGTTPSHEAIEEWCDPDCDVWMPIGDGRDIALEPGDAVEATSYTIPIKLGAEERQVLVSNFCLPAYYVPGSPGPWDFLGMLAGPLSVLAGGYQIIRERDGSVVDLYSRSDRLRAKLLAFKRADPNSRTARRHGSLPPAPVR